MRVLAAALLALFLGQWAIAADSSTAVVAVSGDPSPFSACDLALATDGDDGSELHREIERLRRIAAGQAADDPAVRLDALERLGWLLVEKARDSADPGFYTLAESCARCMREADADNLQALLLLGHVHHSLHRFRDSEVVARELVARRGAWFDHALLGDALMERGQLDQAAEHYQVMMDQRPGPQSYSRASHMRWLLGDVAGAVELMEMAVRSVSPRSRESTAWMLSRLAQHLVHMGQGQKAADLLRKALATLPDYPLALLVQGKLLLATENYAAAIEPLRRAAEVNPLPDYLWALLEALQAAGGHADDVERVRARLLATGTANDARSMSLYLASARLQVETALRLARSEISRRSDVYTLDALAWALVANGQSAQAYEVSQSALADGTQDARLFYHAGVIAAHSGFVAQADGLLRRAAALDHMLFPSERKDLSQERARISRQLAS